MNKSKNPTLQEKAKALINWSALSEQLSHNKDSIRSTRYPDKYKEEIELLLSYVEAWLNCKELTTKESIINELEFIVEDRFKEISKEILNLGKNALSKS